MLKSQQNEFDKLYQKKDNVERCPNCGAPITSEVCQYCGAATGLDTRSADMIYPSVEVKEAHLNFWNTLFPTIFAVSFGFFGFVFPAMFASFGEDFGKVMLMCVPFAAIGVVSLVIVFKNVLSFLIVRFSGEEVIGTVYGYMDDNVMYNNVSGQKVKILVNTRNDKKFILYQLNSPDKPYAINSCIKLRVYKNYCKIVNTQSILD